MKLGPSILFLGLSLLVYVGSAVCTADFSTTNPVIYFYTNITVHSESPSDSYTLSTFHTAYEILPLSNAAGRVNSAGFSNFQVYFARVGYIQIAVTCGNQQSSSYFINIVTPTLTFGFWPTATYPKTTGDIFSIAANFTHPSTGIQLTSNAQDLQCSLTVGGYSSGQSLSSVFIANITEGTCYFLDYRFIKSGQYSISVNSKLGENQIYSYQSINVNIFSNIISMTLSVNNTRPVAYFSFTTFVELFSDGGYEF